MSEPDAIDHKALDMLLEAVGGDAAFLAELIDTYFVDSRELLASMRQALVTKDAPGLQRAAHSLKSNSASFGAHTLTRLCRELEERGKDNRLEGADALVDQIEKEYNRVERSLQAARPPGYQ